MKRRLPGLRPLGSETYVAPARGEGEDNVKRKDGRPGAQIRSPFSVLRIPFFAGLATTYSPVS